MGRALARAVQSNCPAVQGVQRDKEPQPARSASPRSQSAMGKVVCSKNMSDVCLFMLGRQAGSAQGTQTYEEQRSSGQYLVGP